MFKSSFLSGLCETPVFLLDVGNEHKYIPTVPHGGDGQQKHHRTQLTASEEIIPQTSLASLELQPSKYP